MKIFEAHFSDPVEQLACDEALLEASEDTDGGEVLRFWESMDHFVVLGYSGALKEEVRLPASVPVLRRCSGGGTVLQGPGCLNYSLILRIEPATPTDTIHATNEYVMERNRRAMQGLLGRDVHVKGYTDLAVGATGRSPLLKFSGNAQRRKRKRLLFHGTFLLSFDAKRMDETLLIPEKQPCYRENRPHSAFVTNLGVDAAAVKQAMAAEWKASGKTDAVPRERIKQLIEERYSRNEWNLKF